VMSLIFPSFFSRDLVRLKLLNAPKAAEVMV
jgi:hypothetical protein